MHVSCSPVLAGEEVNAASFRAGLGRFVTGVTVMTSQTQDGRRAGVTVSSFNALSLDPPLILWSLAVNAPSLPLFRQAGRFAVNILAHGQQAIAKQFARAAADKFANVETLAGLGSVPLIAGAVAHLECDLADRHAGGDHEIIVGRLRRLTLSDHPPLAYHQGRFGQFLPEHA